MQSLRLVRRVAELGALIWQREHFFDMSAKQKISIVALVAIALATSYWTGYIHGSGSMAAHERIISVALPIILIWTLTKLTFGLRRLGVRCLRQKQANENG